ncbi:uncharacterized protein [Panulirus ornatus]|uniref:uncharacterized protein n=1 Tax=Panulirus ornatus TaxID=150431 RepID=UPI003A8A0A9F
MVINLTSENEKRKWFNSPVRCLLRKLFQPHGFLGGVVLREGRGLRGVATSGSCKVSDIQEFYEITLLDDSKSVQQKTAETLQIASKWEINSGPMAPHITCTKDSHLF